VQTPEGTGSYQILDFERPVDVDEVKDPRDRSMVDHTLDAGKPASFSQTLLRTAHGLVD
jgi:hypothetical protein